MSTRVENGATERIRATALSATAALLTGLGDVLIEIRRKSDGFYYDFNDSTFKAAGWTTRQQAMTELDATNSAGTYYYDFNTSGLSDDEYFIRVTSVTAVNVPQEGELKVGGLAEQVKEVWQELNLDPSNPVTRTETSTSFDDVTVTHTGNPEISITSTRS